MMDHVCLDGVAEWFRSVHPRGYTIMHIRRSIQRVSSSARYWSSLSVCGKNKRKKEKENKLNGKNEFLKNEVKASANAQKTNH